VHSLTMKFCLSFLISLGLFNSQAYGSIAQDSGLADVYTQYKMGDYETALDKLNALMGDEDLRATVFYMKGLCHSKLQEYGKSVANFKRAIRSGSDAKDLYYEYGQALFATKNYSKAKMAFVKSIRNRHLQDTSLFYLGYVSQTQKQYGKAKKFYRKLIRYSYAKKDLIQASHFNIAKIYLAQAEKTPYPAAAVEKYVIPALNTALGIDEKSLTSTDIRKKKYAVMKKYDLLGYKLANGRMLSRQRWALSAIQSTTYDSNVVQEADQTTLRATQKSSWSSKSTASASWEQPIKKRLVVTPSISAFYQHYFDRTHSNIYQNDQYGFTPVLEASYEHTLFKKPGSLIFTGTYDYLAKDYKAKKKKLFFSRSYTFSIGEKFNLFDIGFTQFVVSRKDYNSYRTSSDSKTTTVSLNQAATMPWWDGHLMLATLYGDFNRYSSRSQNTNDYGARIDYFVQDVYYGITVGPYFTLILTDTMSQDKTRGMEKSYNPGIKANKTWLDHFTTEIDYNYVNKTSKDKKNYDYTEHMIAFNLSFFM